MSSIIDACKILYAGMWLKIVRSTERKFSRRARDTISCFVFDETLKIPWVFSKNRYSKTEEDFTSLPPKKLSRYADDIDLCSK